MGCAFGLLACGADRTPSGPGTSSSLTTALDEAGDDVKTQVEFFVNNDSGATWELNSAYIEVAGDDEQTLILFDHLEIGIDSTLIDDHFGDFNAIWHAGSNVFGTLMVPESIVDLITEEAELVNLVFVTVDNVFLIYDYGSDSLSLEGEDGPFHTNPNETGGDSVDSDKDASDDVIDGSLDSLIL